MEQRREATARVQGESLTLARLVAHDHELRVGEAETLLAALARTRRMREMAVGGDTVRCTSILTDVRGDTARFPNLGLLRADGTPICSAEPVPADLPGSPQLRETLATTLRTGRFAVSPYLTSEGGGRPILLLTTPVVDSAGTPRAAVFAALGVDWLSGLVAEAHLPEGAALVMLDTAGTILTRRPGAALWSGRAARDTPLGQRLAGPGEALTFREAGVDGEERLYAAASFADSRGVPLGHVLVGIPEALASRGADRALQRNLAVLFLIGALALLTTWIAGYYLIHRPVGALLGAIRQLEAGEGPGSLPLPQGESELGEVGRAFQKMALALHARRAELERTAGMLRRQALIFETVLEGVLITDERGRIIDWNPAAAALFGYTREEALGRSPAFFHHPSVGDRIERQIMAAMEAEGRWAGELPYRRKDGREGVSDVVVVAQYDPGGRRIAHVGVNRDITERKRTEESLRASEARFRSVFEHSPLGIIEGPFPDGPAHLNPALQRILGLSPVCALSQIAQRTHPDDLAEDTRLFQEMVEGKRDRYELRKRFVAPDGETVHAVVHLSLVRDGVGGPHIVGVVEDVTERQRAEEALRLSEQQFRQSQKMEAVGRLAGGIAHDFNNLLTTIRGNAEMALLDLPTGNPVALELEQIREASETAGSLTRQLLSFSRGQPAERSVVDLNEVVERTGRMLQRFLGPQVELRTRLQGEAAWVQVDRGQIEQILVNLAVNARDAMPGGGVLVEEVSLVQVPEERPGPLAPVPPGPYVMLSVGDTGHGMDDATRERVFEPFFTTKEKGKGTGLGLFVVYGVVTQHGGHAWIESEPGQGTTVRILLPRAAPGPAESAPVAAPAQGGTETILLVDDEEPIRSLTKRILERHGYRVVLAAGGNEALEIASRHPGPIDLLLTDVLMPRMSGRELAARFRVQRPEARIAFMSGYTDDVPVDGIGEPGRIFIQKPFTLDILTQKVREALSRGRAPGGLPSSPTPST